MSTSSSHTLFSRLENEQKCFRQEGKERERLYVRERENECASVCERERARERMSKGVCVRESGCEIGWE